MKVWWDRLSLHNKLQIPIQLALLLLLLAAQIWVTGEFKKELFDNAEQRAINSATQSFWGLNSMMLNGNISRPEARIVYFKKMAKLDGVTDFHLVRGKPVQDQFGIGIPEEQARDEMDIRALSSNQVQILYVSQNKPGLREATPDTLRVVVPFAASHDFRGTDCLQCHHVAEGAVNGAVSLTVGLDREHRELAKVRTLFLAGQLLLQVLLFFLIGAFIRKAILPVIKLEKTMLAIEVDGDLNKQVQIESGDEIGHIAQVFNNFLRYMAELRKQLEDKVTALKKYRDKSEEEQRVGGFIMSRMTRIPASLDTRVQRHLRPAEHLSGDILIATRSPDGTIYVLLADAIGHGLTAAVNVLPLCQTFYDLAEKGFSIGQIAADLNLLVHKFMPADRFVSAVLVSIHGPDRIIDVWNGGIPPPLLFNRAGQVVQRFTSANLALGILPGGHFSAQVDSCQYPDECQLCLFSDGLVEATSPAGKAFGEARVIELMGGTGYEKRFPALIAGIDRHLAGQPAHDDISLALIDIRHEASPAEFTGSGHLSGKPQQGGNDWRILLSLGAAELKYLDAVPLLTQIVAKLDVTREHHSALFMILSELFNNALDHGLLQLDSSLKSQADGFDKYLELRDARLRALQNGKIEIEITPLGIGAQQAVQIRVADSGAGFDHSRYTQESGLMHQEPFGRGINLIKSMAHRLAFSERGNEVVVCYVCS